MNLRSVFNDLMKKHHRQGVLLGQTTVTCHEEYFGFEAGHVKTIHFHKRGVGHGIWFRLNCGRVVDEVAVPQAGDPDLYDRSAAWG
jgi:hypothetical protein